MYCMLLVADGANRCCLGSAARHMMAHPDQDARGFCCARRAMGTARACLQQAAPSLRAGWVPYGGGWKGGAEVKHVWGQVRGGWHVPWLPGTGALTTAQLRSAPQCVMFETSFPVAHCRALVSGTGHHLLASRSPLTGVPIASNPAPLNPLLNTSFRSAQQLPT